MVGQLILVQPIGVQIPVSQSLDSLTLFARSRQATLRGERDRAMPSDGERGRRPSRTGVEAESRS